ncbi:hypothetical protein CPAR01_03737, partial [Colletotrichum paranaense]
ATKPFPFDLPDRAPPPPRHGRRRGRKKERREGKRTKPPLDENSSQRHASSFPSLSLPLLSSSPVPATSHCCSKPPPPVHYEPTSAKREDQQTTQTVRMVPGPSSGCTDWMPGPAPVFRGARTLLTSGPPIPRCLSASQCSSITENDQVGHFFPFLVGEHVCPRLFKTVPCQKECQPLPRYAYVERKSMCRWKLVSQLATLNSSRVLESCFVVFSLYSYVRPSQKDMSCWSSARRNLRGGAPFFPSCQNHLQ